MRNLTRIIMGLIAAVSSFQIIACTGPWDIPETEDDTASLITAEVLEFYDTYTYTNVLSGWGNSFRFIQPTDSSAKNFSSFFSDQAGVIHLFYPKNREIWEAYRYNGIWSHHLVMATALVFNHASFAEADGSLYALAIVSDINGYLLTTDAFILKWNPASLSWTNETTVASGLASWSSGPKDLPELLLPDANSDLQIFYRHDGWFSYGYSYKVRSYYTASKTLSALSTVSARSGNVDYSRNWLLGGRLRADGALSLLLVDSIANPSIFIMDSAATHYGFWFQPGSDIGINAVGYDNNTVRYGNDGVAHAAIITPDNKIYYWKSSTNTSELVAESGSTIFSLATIAVTPQGKVYIAWQENVGTTAAAVQKVRVRAKGSKGWTETITMDSDGFIQGNDSVNHFYTMEPILLSSANGTAPEEVLLTYTDHSGTVLATNGNSQRGKKIVRLAVNRTKGG